MDRGVHLGSQHLERGARKITRSVSVWATWGNNKKPNNLPVLSDTCEETQPLSYLQMLDLALEICCVICLFKQQQELELPSILVLNYI